jgi:beta-phosphoglucomutase
MNDRAAGRGFQDRQAGRLGIAPENCVLFEGAVLGLEAAKRAGMFCVAIHRYNVPERQAKADIVIRDLAEVTADHLRRWFTQR